jgi:hypothetical protein
MGTIFPKEIITSNVLSPTNAMQALRGGVFLPILNLRVVVPDPSSSGTKHITGIYLQVKYFKHKKTDAELTTSVETKYKMDKQVMEHTVCHNEGGRGFVT